MIKIYKLVPEPKLMGSFENGILKIYDKEIKMSRDDVKDRFSRGYWRLSKV